MENVADIYDEMLVTPVCPSVTRWTGHDRACKCLCDGYKQFLHTLGVCVNEHSEPEATGYFAEITDGFFIATILMLRDVFEAVQPHKKETTHFVKQIFQYISIRLFKD